MRRRDRQAIARAFFEGAPPLGVESIKFHPRWKRVIYAETVRRQRTAIIAQETIIEDCIREFSEPASRAWGRK